MNVISVSEKKKKHPVETETVLQRLKDRLGIRTNVELSDILDIKPNTLSTWKKRNTLDYKRILNVCHTYRLDINRLFFNHNTPPSPRSGREKRGFFVVPREEYYPYVTNYRDPSYINTLPRFDFPFVSGSKVRAFQIVGSGMSPRLKDGDFVVGEYVENTDAITDHYIYVLVSKVKGIFINRVKQDPESPGFLLLINDRKQVSPGVRMSADEIVELWKINSVFSLDLIGERGKSKVL
ncbi:LexA family transcriptional regulator [Sinomicrobium weinanense]|uniref:Helix-turn-helix domain-containing protein n=1 Tax=Sinomicrobium weinanense TaxID=2842200 RepID=A0A926JNG9_9FLAO|nr:helix-turn-helix domain-containing protein [Sinomicrobium weinanense]MBC9794525.1 helix-turn-helix domain-containing protein [Sinomicrobium weinanense]MBU3124432.1 helix-turn-helix domain-containing protein [Sinomicrobium weinanense]